MTIRSLRSLVGALLLLACAPAIANAQIYAWRDSSGNWVLSDRPKDPSADIRTYPVRTRPAQPADLGASIGPTAPTGMTGATSANAEGYRTTTGALSRRSAQFDALIEEHAAAQGVSPHLVRAVIQQESAFNPRAVSPKGAMGLMQLMPATAAEFGVLDPYNPGENIRAGVTYLKGLLVKFAQNIELALAAYNAGPTAVNRYGTVPPYRETQNYVKRIKSAVNVAPKPVRIYKTVEIVNGREVTRYSTVETAGSEFVTTAKR
jgi:soluble lytic murein transglycosylase-like protein